MTRNPLNKISFILPAIMATVVFANTAAAQTQASEGFTLTPLHPNAVKPNQFIYELKPGDTLTDEVIVRNENPEQQNFWLYAADQNLNETNAFEIYRPEDTDGNTFIGRWVVPEKQEFPLPGYGDETIKIRITIPKDAPLGEYTGGLAFERRKFEEKNPNLMLAFRVINKINLKVTNDPQPVPMLQTGWTPNPYLLGSSGLFLGSMIYYFAARRKEKKRAKANGQKGKMMYNKKK